MALEDYKVVLYRNQPSGWVAEVPAIPGCYALMSSRSEALIELEQVFEMIADEYREKDMALATDTTEIVHPSARADDLRRVDFRRIKLDAWPGGSHQATLPIQP